MGRAAAAGAASSMTSTWARSSDDHSSVRVDQVGTRPAKVSGTKTHPSTSTSTTVPTGTASRGATDPSTPHTRATSPATSVVVTHQSRPSTTVV